MLLADFTIVILRVYFEKNKYREKESGGKARLSRGRRNSMAVVTMKSLLESGVHFGHQVKRWDPRMKKYIFAERNGIHIIDLQKTIVSIKDAYDAIR